MLKVTENAARRIQSMLRENRSEKNQLVRMISTGTNGFAFVLSEKQFDDEIIKIDGKEVLAINTGTTPLLQRMVLDLVETEEGGKLTLRPENASTSP